MSDRQSIGLDNPAFRGRLRQPTGLAQSLHVAPKLKAPRPSARYYNQYANRPIATIEKTTAQPVAVVTTLKPQPAPAVIQKPVLHKITQPVFRADWQTGPAAEQQIADVRKPAAPVLHKAHDQSHVLKRQTLHQPVAAAAALSQAATNRPITATTPTMKQTRNLKAKLLRKPKLPNISQYSRPQLAMFAMGIAVFLIGVTVSVSTLRTNHAASAQVEALAKTTVEQPATTDSAEGGHVAGASTTTAAPSTVRPTAAAVNNYAVGPTLPRYLDIPRFGVHARVLSLGILNSGALATPNNVYDAGWYNMSAKPGEAGATLMDGHVSSWTSHGVFYNISKLVPGDQLTITRGDGQVITYEVVKSQTFDKDNVDMQSAVTPVDPTRSGLNLITCTGQVIKGTNEFSKRILVYAKQV